MKVHLLSEMTRGWFIGNFEPSLYRTNDVEVAIQHFTAGEKEAAHYHMVATEITAIISGEFRMNGRIYKAGEMVTLAPGEHMYDFEALTDVVTTVVKIPGANNDKYPLLAEDIAKHRSCGKGPASES